MPRTDRQSPPDRTPMVAASECRRPCTRSQPNHRHTPPAGQPRHGESQTQAATGAGQNEGGSMHETDGTRGRTARWVGAAGLLVAGAVTGGVLAGTLSANAATGSAGSGTSYSSTASGESTQSQRATYPAHGTAAHEALEKPVSGTNATKAQQAAVKAVGGGTAGAVTTDVSGNGYEVTVTKSDGSKVEVHLDRSFGLDDHGRLG